MHQEGGRPGHNPHFVVPIHLACPSHMTGESGEHPPSARSASAPRCVDIGAFTYKAREISSANLQFLRHNILGTTILRLTPQPFMSSFFVSPLLCVVLHVPADRSADRRYSTERCSLPRRFLCSVGRVYAVGFTPYPVCQQKLTLHAVELSAITRRRLPSSPMTCLNSLWSLIINGFGALNASNKFLTNRERCNEH